MMKLWRVDADFEVEGQTVGMLTWFLLGEPGAWEATLHEGGWRCDSYPEDLGEISRADVGELVSRPWPTLPTPDLVAIVRGRWPLVTAHVNGDEPVELADIEQLSPPLADAKQQLQAAIEHRGQSAARVAWENE